MAKDKGFTMVMRRIQRQHVAALMTTRANLIEQVRRIPRPSEHRAALLRRIRTLTRAIGFETPEEQSVA